jgi:hypothetical protein
MFILAGLLAIGFVCNWLVRPVDPEHYMTAEQLAATAPKQGADGSPTAATQRAAAGASGALVALAWLAVWIPLGWGIWVTLQKAVLLFK